MAALRFRDFAEAHRALVDDRASYEAEVAAAVSAVFARRRRETLRRLATIRRSLPGDVPVRAPAADGDPSVPRIGDRTYAGTDPDPPAVRVTADELGLGGFDDDLLVATGPVLARQYRRAGRALGGRRWDAATGDALAAAQTDRIRYVGATASAVAATMLVGLWSGHPTWTDLVGTVDRIFGRAEGPLAAQVGRLEAGTVLNATSSVAAATLVDDGTPIRRFWATQGDERVRPAHDDADGQIVDVDEPFDVGGEPLMYPGDPNGSAENVLNCRCDVWFVDGDENVVGVAASPADVDAGLDALLD